ncbi:3-hydroxyisobutyrate dehydrogenase [Aureimonas phyllosphaerae]|uniref:3-hydroxyisobutyrate dehydrogenase n=1 Tax=Aureimonas phyllosphaerae TaxID=1166078 RepID=A0A7W6FTP0_9HYPH|nr:3-hydroxyisobutyrate dehydrogenase [Aureimonas phyllosphaerae]MBB3958958.1 3-hydroxyisobutyrate dehydrogenase [Aureimonas phyllosphaerae]SFF40382.1 3-hydroxyisobutyrate dehydrogenase [Aureimonas phyllosphaerae]
MTTPTIAFIGLGNMGRPMVSRLSVAGASVRAFDAAPAALEAVRSAGVVTAGSLAEALNGADVLVTMLPAGRHVVAVCSEAYPQLPKGALHIDCSSIDIASARSIHASALQHGLQSVDAPVSGGTGGAEAGTLTFMLGGEDAAVDRARPILEPMAGRIVHCGEPGTGQAAKICNNMILGISMIGVCEAFTLAEKLGLSHQALFDVASKSSGQCWSLTSYCPVPGPVPASPANNGYRPGFASALMAKDLGLSQAAAGDADVETPMGALARALYDRLVEEGGGDRDFSGMIEFLRGMSPTGGETAR